ncbi:MAG: thioredoxin family protein [Promethearchaeota archaeon]
MAIINKPIVHVLLKNEEVNFCAKCCKTRNVIEQMIRTLPNLSRKIEIIYKDIEDFEVIEKYGELLAPAIIINETLFSQGHVPIIKKLARELFILIDE